MAENAVGGALDPPPFNTFNGLWLDELKHFIVRTVIWGRVFLGVLLWMKNVGFAAGGG